MLQLPYKNTTAALLFTIFFGPLGLLYSTLRGGIIMVVVAFVVMSSHYPIPVLIMWICCSIWSVSAINRYNLNLLQLRLEKYEEKDSTPLNQS